MAYIDRGAENYAFPELNHLEGIVAKRVESPYHWPLSALAEDQDAHWAGAGEEEVLPGEVAGTVLYRTGQRYMDPLSVSDILARLGGAVIMVVLIIMIIDDYRSRNRHKE